MPHPAPSLPTVLNGASNSTAGCPVSLARMRIGDKNCSYSSRGSLPPLTAMDKIPMLLVRGGGGRAVGTSTSPGNVHSSVAAMTTRYLERSRSFFVRRGYPLCLLFVRPLWGPNAAFLSCLRLRRIPYLGTYLFAGSQKCRPNGHCDVISSQTCMQMLQAGSSSRVALVIVETITTSSPASCALNFTNTLAL